jgi:hypothetical protein
LGSGVTPPLLVPFSSSEGGYADFAYETKDNEAFEADDNEVEQNGGFVPPLNSETVQQPMGRGGGRASFARGWQTQFCQSRSGLAAS